MADFSALKTSIQNYIKQNGNEEITGNLLQQILLSMVSTLGDSAINDLVTALNAEIANRGNADTTLQGNIDNEATARGNADTELGGRITTLQGVVNGIIANIENGYVYAGIATPSSTPASGKVFYLALTAGTYTNFGATVVPQGINILKYNGSAWSLDSFLGLDDAPTQGSNNLVKSGGVLDSIIKNGSAFDLSAYNSGTTYADLSAALTALNALPAAYKKGGMSFKYVQTSDNKYVQYFLTKDEWSSSEADWEKVNTNSGKYLLMTFGNTPGYVPLISVNKKISLNKTNLSIGVSNLINVSKTVPQIIQLSNLWSGAASAPSYVITDENLIVLQVITGVSTSTIDSTSLPDGARFLIANSANKNGVIGTSDLPIADSGIPLYVALELNNSYIIKSASICNSINCFVNKSVQIGSYLSKTNLTIASSSSINCTNLLCIKKEHNLSLTNIYSNSEMAPSYIILDEDFKVLDIQSGISSAIIDIDNLPANSFYLIANSNAVDNIVTVDKFYSLINTGISAIILTEILQIYSNTSSLPLILNSLFEEEEITSTSIKASALATGTTINYLMGRLIECNGGQIEALHFDSTPNPDIDYKIAVLQNVSGNSYKCISVTTIRIDSKDTDLSEYSIQIPSGKIMVAILATSDANIKHTLDSSLDTFENKGIYTNSVNEGSVYNLANNFSFIAPSYYFTMRLSMNKIDKVQKDIEILENSVDTRFKNKNIVFFGDSITWYGGDNCNQDRGWTKYFKQHFEFKTIRSYARSGATLTATPNTQYNIEEDTGIVSDNNVLYNQVNRMIYEIQQGNQEIPDYVFVALGTNDAQRGLDTVNDEITITDNLGIDYSQDVSITTCTTFIRMLRYFHDMMWNVNKDCQIIILTPLQTSAVPTVREKASNQITKCSKYLAWNVIDQFGGSGLSAVSEALGHAKDSSGYDYTADGVHPTARGAKLIGDWIAQQAKIIMRI